MIILSAARLYDFAVLSLKWYFGCCAMVEALIAHLIEVQSQTTLIWQLKSLCQRKSNKELGVSNMPMAKDSS